MNALRTEIALPVAPWFTDHHVAGRMVLAAVEAMQLLATTVHKAYPHLKIRDMQDGRFAKLLAIPPHTTAIPALVEMEPQQQGAVRARLLTRTKGTALRRLIAHCEVTFTPEAVAQEVTNNWAGPQPAEADTVLTASQVYRDLVPFGPAYQTLQDQLILCADTAWGLVQAPEWEHNMAAPLGSPFPLDGAMHAACVHGQQRVDFVPFPVEFATRSILKPTSQGGRYAIRAVLQAQNRDELLYDLYILDQQQQIRELVRGLRMRDVSHGRIKPPAWIKKPGQDQKTT